MFTVIRAPLAPSTRTLPQIWVRTDRVTLAKRIWRGRADDGLEFGFDLEAPLKPGEVVHESAESRYVIRQEPESLLEISLDIAPSAAAGIGWAVGNLHLELSAETSRLLTPDAPSARQLLTRLGIPFSATSDIFRPGRFVRGTQNSHELGVSHKH